jgi:MoaA/NifB/PqqE/SkfB family radical SAM enzyme
MLDALRKGVARARRDLKTPDLAVLKREHAPVPRPRHRVPFSTVVKAGFFLFGVPNQSFCTIDVTNRCNIRCDHCYFFEQDYDRELSLDEWRALFDRMRAEAGLRRYWAFQASFVGGEPLVRKDVIDLARGYFPYNIVVTNGSIPLPDWPDVHFWFSVDGTEAMHDTIRNKPGLYRRMKRHADRPDLHTMVTMCINRKNQHLVEDVIQEWNRDTCVRHILFEFHTPIAGLAENDELRLDPRERDRVLDVVLALKAVYGDFILPPARTYRMMKSDRAKPLTDDCLYAKVAPSLGPDGTRKEPCMLGPKADCDGCGCIVPFLTRAQQERGDILMDLTLGAMRWLTPAR